MTALRRLWLFCVVLALFAIACSQVLGLDDLQDRAPGSSGSSGTSGGEEEGGPPPLPGQECKFDKSKFDDGCVFGP